MPKYILIGIGISLIIFLVINLWTKLSGKIKSRTVATIFGVIAIAFAVLIALLIF